jgi:hypothetical protein
MHPLIAVGAGGDASARDGADERRTIVKAEGVLAVDGSPEAAEIRLKGREAQRDATQAAAR